MPYPNYILDVQQRGGEDFFSLAAAEVQMQADFDGTQSVTLDCRDGKESSSSAVLFDNWTAPQTDEGLLIRPQAGYEHNGVLNDGSYIWEFTGGFADAVAVNIPYFSVSGIQFHNVSTSPYSLLRYNDKTGVCSATNVITSFDSTASNPGSIFMYRDFNIIRNCYGLSTGGTNAVLSSITGSICENNTFVSTVTSNKLGFDNAANSMVLHNNVFAGFSIDYRNFSTFSSRSNNASKDNTAASVGGANSITGISLDAGVDFVDISSGDANPVASPGKLDGAGTYLASTDPDIAGTPRGNPNCEIGAYEIAGAAPGVTATGTPQAQPATTTGTASAFFISLATGAVQALPASTTGSTGAVAVAVATGAVQALPANTTGQVSPLTGGVTITLTLVNESGVPIPNLSNLEWAFFDEALPSTMLAPVDQGSDESTDASGVLTVRARRSLLNPGDTGYFIVSNTDGTEGQDPAQQAFAGPVGTS